MKYPKYGLSTLKLIEIFRIIDQTKRDSFKADLKSIVDSTYVKADEDTKSAIVYAIANGNDAESRQAIAKASFQNYKNQKVFKGLLYIDIKAGRTLYFNDWEDIDTAGAYAKAGTIYLVAAHSSEAPYPQISIKVKG